LTFIIDGFRDYRSQSARFTTLDPVRDGNNWFSYVNNDPVNYVDLWGLSASDNNRKNVENLIEAQKIARELNIYKMGGGGLYLESTGKSWHTFCNLGTFDVARATGFNTDALYNDRVNTDANMATANLLAAAKEGKVIKIDSEQAYTLASQGYTVIAAWEDTGEPRGHIATVSPGAGTGSNPSISNIGSDNQIKSASLVIPGKLPTYFYDPRQDFNKYDPSGIGKK